MLPKALIKEYSRPLATLLGIADIVVIFFTGWLAYALRFSDIFLPSDYWLAIFAGMTFAVIAFSLVGIYFAPRGQRLLHITFNLAKGFLFLSLLLAGVAFFTKSGYSFSRLWFLLWMMTAYVFTVLIRVLLLQLLKYMRIHGLHERRVLIIGDGELAKQVEQTVQHSLWTGFKIVARVDDVIAITLPEIVNREHIDEVWLALPLSAEYRVQTILHELRHHTVTTRYILDIFGLDLLNHSITDLAGFPTLNLRATPMIGANRLLKAIEDRIIAALILLIISPLFIVIALAVKLSSRGPIFYRQKRVGWNGREFEMLKFRSMPVDAENKTGPVWATVSDPRPTVVGKFIRSTSLDELPQFLNVMKGDMSIVGPRPERKIFVDEFKEKIPGYMQKHQVKAGITGWAQVNGWRGNTSLEKRIEYDLYYIGNWSLWFDLKIIVLTIVRGFIHRNAY